MNAVGGEYLQRYTQWKCHLI